VLDYNGYNVFYNFPFSEMGKPIYHDTTSPSAGAGED